MFDFLKRKLSLIPKFGVAHTVNYHPIHGGRRVASPYRIRVLDGDANKVIGLVCSESELNRAIDRWWIFNPLKDHIDCHDDGYLHEVECDLRFSARTGRQYRRTLYHMSVTMGHYRYQSLWTAAGLEKCKFRFEDTRGIIEEYRCKSFLYRIRRWISVALGNRWDNDDEQCN